MRTILVQDDPGLLRTLEQGVLRRSSLKLLLARDRGDLLHRSRVESPDLVILDGNGPEDDTSDLIAALKALPAHPQCVVVELDRTPPGSRTDPVSGAAIQATICDGLGLSTRVRERCSAHGSVSVMSRQERRRGTTRDIGPTGAFVITPAPYGTAQTVELRLRALQSRGVPGRVVRSVPPAADRSHLPGMAICFDTGQELTAAEMETIVSDCAGGAGT
ncbi:MAG: PilZ domain-containing protein [Acidobacteriota bacterium]